MFNLRLLNEATLLGTESILEQMPVEHSAALEQTIRQGVRQAVLRYADGIDTIERQIHPLSHKARA
jgi:hypothetical protein